MLSHQLEATWLHTKTEKGMGQEFHKVISFSAGVRNPDLSAMNNITNRMKNEYRQTQEMLIPTYKYHVNTITSVHFNIYITSQKLTKVMLLTSLLLTTPPSASHPVVGMKLWLDVTDTPQQVTQHRLPVPTVTSLDTPHPLSCVTVHLHSAVAMGTKGLKHQRNHTFQKIKAKAEQRHRNIGFAFIMLQNCCSCW